MELVGIDLVGKVYTTLCKISKIKTFQGHYQQQLKALSTYVLFLLYKVCRFFPNYQQMC